jgi:hypothetical protein
MGREGWIIDEHLTCSWNQMARGAPLGPPTPKMVVNAADAADTPMRWDHQGIARLCAR